LNVLIVRLNTTSQELEKQKVVESDADQIMSGLFFSDDRALC